MDLSKFTQNAQNVIMNCRGLLKKLDHSVIEPEHIIHSSLNIDKFEETEYVNAVDTFIMHTFRDLNIPIYNTSPLICYCPMVIDSDIR